MRVDALALAHRVDRWGVRGGRPKRPHRGDLDEEPCDTVGHHQAVALLGAISFCASAIPERGLPTQRANPSARNQREDVEEATGSPKSELVRDFGSALAHKDAGKAFAVVSG